MFNEWATEQGRPILTPDLAHQLHRLAAGVRAIANGNRGYPLAPWLGIESYDAPPVASASVHAPTVTDPAVPARQSPIVLGLPAMAPDEPPTAPAAALAGGLIEFRRKPHPGYYVVVKQRPM